MEPSNKKIILDLIQRINDLLETLEYPRKRLTQDYLEREYNHLCRYAKSKDRANYILLDITDSDLSLTLRGFCSVLLAECATFPRERNSQKEYAERIRQIIEKEEIPAFRIELSYSLSKIHGLKEEAITRFGSLKEQYAGNLETMALIEKYAKRIT